MTTAAIRIRRAASPRAALRLRPRLRLRELRRGPSPRRRAPTRGEACGGRGGLLREGRRGDARARFVGGGGGGGAATLLLPPFAARGRGAARIATRLGTSAPSFPRESAPSAPSAPSASSRGAPEPPRGDAEGAAFSGSGARGRRGSGDPGTRFAPRLGTGLALALAQIVGSIRDGSGSIVRLPPVSPDAANADGAGREPETVRATSVAVSFSFSLSSNTFSEALSSSSAASSVSSRRSRSRLRASPPTPTASSARSRWCVILCRTNLAASRNRRPHRPHRNRAPDAASAGPARRRRAAASSREAEAEARCAALCATRSASVANRASHCPHACGGREAVRASSRGVARGAGAGAAWASAPRGGSRGRASEGSEGTVVSVDRLASAASRAGGRRASSIPEGGDARAALGRRRRSGREASETRLIARNGPQTDASCGPACGVGARRASAFFRRPNGRQLVRASPRAPAIPRARRTSPHDPGIRPVRPSHP